MSEIWIVEDDESVREIELYTLKSTGFTARGFADGESFLEAIRGGEKPELLLLDVMLPGMDGVEILKQIRATPYTSALPVIMATAKGMEYDKVQSLDLGADDYLTKPFGMMEMVSRVRAVLRRSAPKDREIVEYGGLRVDLSGYTVSTDGKPVDLTYKEFELLRCLLKNPRIAFSRDRIMTIVWGGDYMGESRTVDVHIRSLRTKLGKYGEKIKTVRNVGYRFDPEGDDEQ